MKQRYFYFSFICLINKEIAYKGLCLKSEGALLKDIHNLEKKYGGIVIFNRIEITKKEYLEAHGG